MKTRHVIARRTVLGALGALGGLVWLPCSGHATARPLSRPIPSTGERIPVVGLGTWLTFDVGGDPARMAARQAVLRAFFDAGGQLVDSSPMYGSAEEVIGWGLKRQKRKPKLFSATKVWTPFGNRAPDQMRNSEHLWGTKPIDLQQVHNLLNWQDHLKTLMTWKAEGRIRYVGVTTSHGRRHDELAQVMAAYPLDFVQFSYNVLDREAENRLLPLAADRGIAVIINRPFRTGGLFDQLSHHPLPRWASDIKCTSWAQFFLKFIISHPAVTCAIPATAQVAHVRENMASATGPLPDASLRQRMTAYVDGLV